MSLIYRQTRVLLSCLLNLFVNYVSHSPFPCSCVTGTCFTSAFSLFTGEYWSSSSVPWLGFQRITGRYVSLFTVALTIFASQGSCLLLCGSCLLLLVPVSTICVHGSASMWSLRAFLDHMINGIACVAFDWLTFL
jgi:hypothetical protein